MWLAKMKKNDPNEMEFKTIQRDNENLLMDIISDQLILGRLSGKFRSNFEL